MLLRRSHLAITLSLTVLLASPAALAAPPDTGSRAPELVAPTTITADYVGPALAGPRGFCGPIGTGTVQAASMCVDVVRRGCRAWRRGSDGWLPARVVFNDSPTVFWVAPYARGWHWAWSLSDGFRTMPTACLTAHGPLMS